MQDKPEIISKLVTERRKKGMTQSQVAIEMGATASAVARLEGGGGKRRHSPSLRTISLYAQVIGCKIKMNIEAV